MGNLVAIVGRPNVGKSTLFNRLTKTRQAIVNEEAGTTRDRQYGKSEWLGREFSVVDTGGWVVNSDDVFEEEIRKQVLLAVDEADVILFVVDVMNGVVRAGLEQTRKQYEAAEADFTKAISLEPKNIDYLLNRAALYIETKRKKEARADLDKAMELGANPEDVASMRHELR